MARIRTVKPELFRHEDLYQAECATGLPLRLAFIGLWTVADREGRFRWRPAAIKLDVLPYDDIDFSRVLDALATRGFVVRYASPTVNGVQEYGFIPTWRRHQVINTRERASELPDMKDCEVIQCDADASRTRRARVTETHVRAQGEGEGEKEGEGERKLRAPDGALELFQTKSAEPKTNGHAPADAETELYRRGKELLGKSGGGLVKRLLAAKGGKVALARAVLETASTKSDPRAYVGGAIRGAEVTDYGSSII